MPYTKGQCLFWPSLNSLSKVWIPNSSPRFRCSFSVAYSEEPSLCLHSVCRNVTVLSKSLLWPHKWIVYQPLAWMNILDRTFLSHLYPFSGSFLSLWVTAESLILNIFPPCRITSRYKVFRAKSADALPWFPKPNIMRKSLLLLSFERIE